MCMVWFVSSEVLAKCVDLYALILVDMPLMQLILAFICFIFLILYCLDIFLGKKYDISIALSSFPSHGFMDVSRIIYFANLLNNICISCNWKCIEKWKHICAIIDNRNAVRLINIIELMNVTFSIWWILGNHFFWTYNIHWINGFMFLI